MSERVSQGTDISELLLCRNCRATAEQDFSYELQDGVLTYYRIRDEGPVFRIEGAPDQESGQGGAVLRPLVEGGCMSERVIAKRLEDYVVGVPKQVEPDGDIDFDQYEAYIADPDAPSVSEVVEVLREARGEYDAMLGHADRPTEGEIPDRIDRIDNLIARLES